MVAEGICRKRQVVCHATGASLDGVSAARSRPVGEIERRETRKGLVTTSLTVT